MKVTDDFIARFSAAKIGEAVCYHVGFLARDREGENNPLVSLAAMVVSLAKQGKAILVQRKLTDKDYEYLAVKSDHARSHWWRDERTASAGPASRKKVKK